MDPITAFHWLLYIHAAADDIANDYLTWLPAALRAGAQTVAVLLYGRGG